MNIDEQKVYYNELWRKQDKLNSLKLRRAIKILDYFVRVKKEIQVPRSLDLGCGEGRLTSFMGEFSDADGIELSKTAVEIASSHYAHVNYFEGNILEYNFKENYYDVVISQEVIEHIVDQELYLKICNRVLRKGGYLILTTPNKRVLDHMKDGSEWSNQPIENVLTPHQLKRIVSHEFNILDYDSIILNFGKLGRFSFINSRYCIGLFNKLGLKKTRERLLGKFGYGLHQTLLARKE